jgi:hypothetical protein
MSLSAIVVTVLKYKILDDSWMSYIYIDILTLVCRWEKETSKEKHLAFVEKHTFQICMVNDDKTISADA